MSTPRSPARANRKAPIVRARSFNHSGRFGLFRDLQHTLPSLRVNVHAALRAINGSSGRSWCTLQRFPENVLTGEPYRFALGMHCKDMANAMELLGDATMVTARAGTGMVAVKAAKDYRAKIGEQVSISIPKTACHLFDSASGARIGEG